MRIVRPFPAYLAACLLLAASCNGGSSEDACTPGKVEVCPCPGGVVGTQMCKDDGSGFDACTCPSDTTGGGTDTTATAGSATAASSTSAAGSTASSSGAATMGTGTSVGASTGDTTVASTTGAGTGGGAFKWLQNDGFFDGAMAAFQMGFVQGECWASVYVPDPGDYPFQVTGVQALIGGNTDMATFTLQIWSVDAANKPMALLDEADIGVTGADDAFNEADFDVVMINKPTITDGNFAIAMCLTSHDGFPAIARDADGTITAERNWIFAQGFGWVQSNTLGLQGDWIMRARIEPQ